MKTLREYIDLVAEQSVEEGLSKSFEIICRDRSGETYHMIVDAPTKKSALAKFQKNHTGLDVEQIKQLSSFVDSEIDEDATPEAISTINDLYNDK